MFQKTKSGSFHIRRGEVVRGPGPRGGEGRRGPWGVGAGGLPEQRSRAWHLESGGPGSEGLRVSPVDELGGLLGMSVTAPARSEGAKGGSSYGLAEASCQPRGRARREPGVRHIPKLEGRRPAGTAARPGPAAGLAWADSRVPAGHLPSSAAGHRGHGWDARVSASRRRQAGHHPPEAFLLRRPQDGRGHHL